MKFFAFTVILSFFTIFEISSITSHADTTTYIYDDSKRLQDVVIQNENITSFGHDNVGNRTIKESKNTGAVASLSATPSADANYVVTFDASGSSCFELGAEKICDDLFMEDFGGPGSLIGGNNENTWVYQYDDPGTSDPVTYTATLTVSFNDLNGVLIDDSQSISVSPTVVAPAKIEIDFFTSVFDFTVTLAATLPENVEGLKIYWSDQQVENYNGSLSNLYVEHEYYDHETIDIYNIRVEIFYEDKVFPVSYFYTDDEDLSVLVPSYPAAHSNPSNTLNSDFNGDGMADILFRHKTTGQLLVYQMDTNTISEIDIVTNLNLEWDVVDISDFGGDGKADILLRHTVTGQLWLYQLNGSTIISSASIGGLDPALWDVAGVTDFNGDNMSDILLRHKTTGQLWQYQMNGNIITSSASVTGSLSLDWKVVGVGDFGADTKGDILLRYTATGQLWLYQMDGFTITSSAAIITVNPVLWDVAGLSDFNGDGRVDILLRNTVDGSLYQYQMSGNTIINNVPVSGLNFVWSIVEIGDFSGDGKGDLMLRNTGTGQLWLFELDGATIISSTNVGVVSQDLVVQ
ncbi:MAG: VCBS repeat-containing protein [bacterium]